MSSLDERARYLEAWQDVLLAKERAVQAREIAVQAREQTVSSREAAVQLRESAASSPAWRAKLTMSSVAGSLRGPRSRPCHAAAWLMW